MNPIADILEPFGKRRAAVAGRFMERGSVEEFTSGCDETSMFDIGSITKTFTGLLLALFVERGLVRYETDVRDLLPPDIDPPSITLERLATHRSGLPRLPQNLEQGMNEEDPYAHYDEDRLYDALTGLKIEPADHVYSNFGFMLLAHVLAVAAGRPYPDLLREDIFVPLGMDQTVVGVPPKRVEGMNEGKPAAPWHMPIPGAGGVWSCLSDMTMYLRAIVDPRSTPLGSSLEEALRPRAPAAQNSEVGLAWMTTTAGRSFTWHNGGTAGWSSFIGIERSLGRGCVALLGHAPDPDVDSACARLLISESPT